MNLSSSSILIALLFLAIIGFIFLRWIKEFIQWRRLKKKKLRLICTRCGTTLDRKDLKNPGNTLMELVLWLWLIIPGLLYSIWRRSKEKLCPQCGSDTLVPENTPVGKRLSGLTYRDVERVNEFNVERRS
jgi:ribosomal protein S27AE